MITTDQLKELLDSPKSEAIAESWDDIEPILLAQQRALSCKDGCSTEEMRGFTVSYNVLALFAKTGKERIATRAKNQPKPR